MYDQTTLVDCEAGRQMGCATFCCRLIVRLGDEERARHPGGPAKSCVDKDPDDGLCVHLCRDTHVCQVWDRRPRICRLYDCNRDPLLQVVLRDGFVSLAALVRAEPPPRAAWQSVPLREG